MTEKTLNIDTAIVSNSSNHTVYLVGKLVRDRIEYANSDIKGIDFKLKTLKNIKIPILRKLIEEINELKKEIYTQATSSMYNICEEIADCFDVLVYALQAWDNKFKKHSINQIKAYILQNIDEQHVNLRPGEISHKMYALALEALKSNNEHEKVIKLLNEICGYLLLIITKFNISLSIVDSLSIGKNIHRGGFEKKHFLTHIIVENDHYLKDVYEKKYGKNSNIRKNKKKDASDNTEK